MDGMHSSKGLKERKETHTKDYCFHHGLTSETAQNLFQKFIRQRGTGGVYKTENWP